MNMEKENYNQFLSEHNAAQISQLDKAGIIEFVKAFMDDRTISTISELDREVLGISPDWTEVASFVEKAFFSKTRLRCAIVSGESPFLECMSADRLEYYLD